MKAALGKSHFFPTRVKFLGHIIKGSTKPPLKSGIDAILKLQPPSNKKKIYEFFGILHFFGIYIYKMQLDSRLYNNKTTSIVHRNIKNALMK